MSAFVRQERLQQTTVVTISLRHQDTQAAMATTYRVVLPLKCLRTKVLDWRLSL
jgi:hypothetical protein